MGHSTKQLNTANLRTRQEAIEERDLWKKSVFLYFFCIFYCFFAFFVSFFTKISKILQKCKNMEIENGEIMDLLNWFLVGL